MSNTHKIHKLTFIVTFEVIIVNILEAKKKPQVLTSAFPREVLQQYVIKTMIPQVRMYALLSSHL